MGFGSVYRMKSFTHIGFDLSVSFKVPGKKKVGVFVQLGEENKDGSEPLDLEAAMNKLGWYRNERKSRNKR